MPQREQIDAELLKKHLADVAEHEGELADQVYERLFTKCPDARELFGQYSRANQESMMTETLGAVLNLLDREPWLDGYVRAMGSRHQFSYETPEEMYEPYAEALLETLADMSGPHWTPDLERAWKVALVQVNEMMIAGYVPM